MRLRLQLTLVFGVFIAVILSAFAVSVYLLTERSLRAGVEERAQSALAELTSGAATIAEGLLRLPSDSFHQILIVGQPGVRPDSAAALRAGVFQGGNYNLSAAAPGRTAVALAGRPPRRRYPPARWPPTAGRAAARWRGAVAATAPAAPQPPRRPRNPWR